MSGLSDKHLRYIRKRKWITPFEMQGLTTDGTTGVTLFGSIDDLTELFAEISSFGHGAVKISADGKLIGGFIPCPHDLDPKFEVGFQVHWTMNHDGSGIGAATWKLLQDAVKRGVVIAKATTALDTVLVQDTNSTNLNAEAVTDYLYQVTARGIRTSIGLTREQIEEGALLTLNLEMDAADNETNIYLLGIMMDYAPQMCQGIGSEILPPLGA